MTTTLGLSDSVTRSFARKRLVAFAVPAVILIYLIYAAISFDLGGIVQRARFDNAAILLSDFWSHKTHVTRDNRTGRLTIAIEGEGKGTYPPGMRPDWVSVDGPVTIIDLGQGHIVTYDAAGARMVVPGYGTIDIHPEGGKPVLTAPEPIPDWISVSDNKVAVTTGAGRFNYSRSKVETFKYEAGFTANSSPNWPGSPFSCDRLNPDRSNPGFMVSEVWTNKMWRHGDVAWAKFETILMAFLGTMAAALIALPLSFLAARNFMPLGPLRFATRRVFEFVRGVDGLIWTIVLSRACGPGPMTGALAIALTDTGSFSRCFPRRWKTSTKSRSRGCARPGPTACCGRASGSFRRSRRCCRARFSTIWNRTRVRPR